MSHDKQTIPASIIPHLREYRDDLEREASDPDLTDKKRSDCAQRAFAATAALDHGYISNDVIPEMMSLFSGLTHAQAMNIMIDLRGAVNQMPFPQTG